MHQLLNLLFNLHSVMKSNICWKILQFELRNHSSVGVTQCHLNEQMSWISSDSESMKAGAVSSDQLIENI